VPRRRSWIQWCGDLPGRALGLLDGSAALPQAPEVIRSQLALDVERSERGNAYLSLEPGLRVFRHDAGVLTWAAHRRTAFAVGGLHAPHSPRSLLLAFREEVQNLGFKRALLFPVGSHERASVEEAGFRSLMVGAEAFLDPVAFSLEGGAMADLRQMVNRGQGRFGLEVEEVESEAGRAEILDTYERWLLSRPAGHRMHLLIGTPRLSEPFSRRYFVARNADGIHAAVTLTPGWGGTGYGVDVMARPPDAAPGAMEVALVGALRTLAREGVRRLSLGSCPMLEAVSPPADDSRAMRTLLRWIYRSSLTQRLFAFQGLPRFKAKFRPTWEPTLIAGWPHMGARALYTGCRMWGLFGPTTLGGR
jgi:phosphatidylglycerol lysyltransferase